MAEPDDAAKKAAEDARKAEEDAARKAAGNDDDAELDAIMKDREAVRKLRDQKRAANAEAKELRLKQEAADKLKKEQEEAALKDQNKHKELAERKDAELKAATSKFTDRLIALHLKTEALKAGSVDADAVVALADRAGIKVDENFEVIGVAEAVATLKTSKGYLFGTVDKKVAPPDKPGVPAPRGGFKTNIDGKESSAHQDLEAGFKAKK